MTATVFGNAMTFREPVVDIDPEGSGDDVIQAIYDIGSNDWPAIKRNFMRANPQAACKVSTATGEVCSFTTATGAKVSIFADFGTPPSFHGSVTFGMDFIF